MQSLVMSFLLSLVLALGVSCQKSAQDKHAANQLRINVIGEPPTMDPRKGGDVISSTMHFLLFEGLVRLGTDGKAHPALAETIDVSEDKLTYTFHLRDAKWSSGQMITAYDFEESWKDILSPQFSALNAHLFYPILNAKKVKMAELPPDQLGIRSLDDKTLQVRLEKPTPYFLELISFCVFFPVNKKMDAKESQWAANAGENFSSCGPFLLKSWLHHNEITLVKNPNYWNQKEIALSSIHVSMIGSEMTALSLYEKGELDLLASPLSTLPLDALKALKAAGKLQVRPSAGSTICAFNTQEFPFTNKNLRKAFGYAINRQAIVENITQLGEEAAVGMIPPVLKKMKRTCFFQDANLDEARRLFQKGLEELGLKTEDLALTYTFTSMEVNHKVAEALQQQWREAFGIVVKLESVEHKVLLDLLTKRKFTMAQTPWLAQYSDQMNILERYAFKENAKNYAGWENPRYIHLLERSQMEEGEVRMATLEEAEAIFAEEMPVVPIYHWTISFLHKSYLKNIEPSSIGSIFFEKIAIDPEAM